MSTVSLIGMLCSAAAYVGYSGYLAGMRPDPGGMTRSALCFLGFIGLAYMRGFE